MATRTLMEITPMIYFSCLMALGIPKQNQLRTFRNATVNSTQLPFTIKTGSRRQVVLCQPRLRIKTLIAGHRYKEL
jgi:hypothetical protein